MLSSVVKDPQVSAADLNHDLDLINKWAIQWKMQFNPDPTKQTTEVLFSSKKSSVNHPNLYFNSSIVTRVEDHKHFGSYVEQKSLF